jgi:hypothetical protein
LRQIFSTKSNEAGPCPVANGAPLFTCLAKQPKNRLPRFEPRLVIWSSIDDLAFHHKRIARFESVLNQVERMVKQRVQALAVRLVEGCHVATSSLSGRGV